MELKRVGAVSCAKVLGALYAGIGLIFGAFFALGALVGLGAFAGADEPLFGLLFGAGAVVFMPVFYGVLGAVSGLIVAALYNLIAGAIGGIEVMIQ